MSVFDLSSKKILITGSTSGIGLEMSNYFNKPSVKLFLLARDREKAKNLDLLNGSKFIYGDLKESAEIISDQLDEKIDGIIFNAGIINYQPLKFIDQESFLDLFHVNYFSSIFLLKTLIRDKKINKNASIIFISSLSASLGVKGTLAYSASKASIDSSVKVLANELSRYNIRVNSIAPGIIKTPLLENQVFDNEKLASEQEKYPLGLGDCKDVAYCAHFLLSKASKWITGSVIELNGGYKLN